MKLSLVERETILLYNQAEPMAEVYTHDPHLMEKLYGSLTDTHRLGTVKLWASFRMIWSGCFFASSSSFSIRWGSWV